MKDKSEYTKRVLLKMLTRPSVLIPAMGGLSLILGHWAIDFSSGWLLLGGIGGALVGAGNFLTGLFVHGEKIGKKVIDDMHAEVERASEQSLDQLDRDLSADGDDRTEKALRDLRTLGAKFKDDTIWSGDLNAYSRYEIASGVDQLFHGCVTYLNKSLMLWHTAEDVEHSVSRNNLLDRRERLLEEVHRSIEQITHILGETQTLELETDHEQDLQAMRLELDEKLKIAQKVELEVSAWGDSGLDGIRDSASQIDLLKNKGTL